MHATTICVARRGPEVAIGGDGQVSRGHTILKGNANKIRTLHNDQVITGFAGSVADAFTLFDLFESFLNQHQGDLTKAAIAQAKAWRSDKFLRQLDALMIVADSHHTYILTGTGDVIEPEGDVAAIGSGGDYARSSALALHRHTSLSPEDIVKHSLTIAGDICLYTNHHINIKTLGQKQKG